MSKRRTARQRTISTSSGADLSRERAVEVARETPFLRHPLSRAAVLLILFVTALLVRLLSLDQPPLDFHGARQYRSALIARAYYYETDADVPEALRRSAIASKEQQGILEPPVMEMLASLAYRIVGNEHLWIPRLFSVTFWLIGGVFLYLLARRITSGDGALFAAAFYLLVPFSIPASTSFQPDPLMVMLIILSLFKAYRYYEHPSNRRLVMAGLASGAAILVKPFAAFFVFAAFLSLGIQKHGIRQTLLSRSTLVFALTSLSPVLVFFVYGTCVESFLTGQIKGTLLPHLLGRSFFWSGWLRMTQDVVGHVAVIAAILGTMLLPRGLSRGLLVGLFVGYCAFSLFCSYHTPTHNYYQLPFIPVVALGLGPVAALVMSRLSKASRNRFYRISICAVLALFLVANTHGAYTRRDKSDYRPVIGLWEEIGNVVRHSDRTIWLASNYGRPLQYHGGLAGENWPHGADLRKEAEMGRLPLSVEERFQMLRNKRDAEYFIVVLASASEEFQRQRKLREFLASTFSVFKRNNNYLVYDLNAPAGSGNR
ncbi:MAG: glycosyltransferase family 39 protein [Planctomycetota bacterium]